MPRTAWICSFSVRIVAPTSSEALLKMAELLKDLPQPIVGFNGTEVPAYENPDESF